MTENKSPISLIVAIISSVIALITPRFLIFIPLLLILCASIITFIRNEKGKYLGIVTIIFALFLFSFSRETNMSSIRDEEQASKENSENYILNYIELTKKDSHREGDYYYVEGRFKNKGQEVLKSITEKVMFIGKDNSILDTERDLIYEDIGINESKEFKVMHEFRKEYKSFRVEFEDAKLKN